MVAALSLLLALALALAAYLGIALRRTRRETAVRPALDALFGTVHGFVGREVAGAREEAQRARDLMHDAVAQLHAALAALKKQARQQAELVASFATQDPVDSPGILGFAQEARGLVAGLTHTMNAGSHESVKTVEIIDRMARQLDGIFELLSDLEGLGRQTATLAGNAAARSGDAGGEPQRSLAQVADEVRHLAEGSADFNARMRELVNAARDTMASVRERVEATAERDMNASIEAKTRADAMAEQAVAINRALASGVRDASDNSRRIEDGVGAAALALKFEESAARAIEAIEAHLARLKAVGEEAAELRQTLNDPAQTPLVRGRALERFRRQLQLHRL